MFYEQAASKAQSMGLIASEYRVGYGPIHYELHDSDGWLFGQGDSWELAFLRAEKKAFLQNPDPNIEEWEDGIKRG